MTSIWRDERGSAAVEVTMVAPVLVLFVLVIIFGGRLALARQAVQSAAFDAARAASLARTQPDARTAAAKTAAATQPSQKLLFATTHSAWTPRGSRSPSEPGPPSPSADLRRRDRPGLRHRRDRPGGRRGGLPLDSFRERK